MPGVAEEMADGVVRSPTVGCLGADGEGGAATGGLLSLLYERNWLRTRGSWRAHAEAVRITGCWLNRDSIVVRQLLQIIVANQSEKTGNRIGRY